MNHPSTPKAAEAARARPGPPPGKDMLFCIGAQKAGTTWLASVLRPRPECHFAPFKEVHYFDVASGVNAGQTLFAARQIRQLCTQMENAAEDAWPGLVRRIESRARMLALYRGGPKALRGYLQLMAEGAGEARYLCDFTPDYAYVPEGTLRNMASLGEAPKFLYILRDPVDRLWSQARMVARFRGAAEAELQAAATNWLRDFIADEPMKPRRHCNYRVTVTRMEEVLPAENRLVLFYEDMFRQESLDRICDFLGIARFAGDFSVVHEGSRASLPEDLRAETRLALADAYDFAAERYGEAVPAAWRRHDA